MTQEGGPTPRAQPFYCPYCGEQDFVPFGEEEGGYLCNSCNRHFTIRFVGLGRREPVEGRLDGPYGSRSAQGLARRRFSEPRDRTRDARADERNADAL